jgi:hypothetical protein
LPAAAQSQQRPLLRAAQSHPLGLHSDLNRPEDQELHFST